MDDPELLHHVRLWEAIGIVECVLLAGILILLLVAFNLWHKDK